MELAGLLEVGRKLGHNFRVSRSGYIVQPSPEAGSLLTSTSIVLSDAILREMQQTYLRIHKSR